MGMFDFFRRKAPDAAPHQSDKMRYLRSCIALPSVGLWLLVICGVARGDERSPRQLLFDAVLWANGAALDRALARGATLETRNDEGDTPLLWAVKGGAVKGEALLLKHGANIRARDRQGVSVLHAASQECVPLLVRYGADVNERDARGATRLMREVGSTEEYVVRSLLEHGADPNLRDYEGQTALMFAYSQYVPLLLSHGADVDARDKRGETVLMKWIWNGNHWFRHDAKDVTLLLRRGANVHLPHPRGSAVQRAAKFVNVAIAREILRYCALTVRERASLKRAVLSDGLFVAANTGDAKLARGLLERGADPNVVLNDGEFADDDGCTPLMIASKRSPDPNADRVAPFVARREEARDVEVARLLLERGAAPDTQFELPIGGVNGDFALQYAAAANKPNLVQVLLQYKANPNLRHENGWTALFSAVGSPAATRVLLRGGADPKVRLTSGATALLAATGEGHPEVVKMLLARGADPNAGLFKSTGATYELIATPLISSVRHYRQDGQREEDGQQEGARIARMLLAAGARLNQRDQWGQTALLEAAAYGNSPLTKLLLRAGADTEARDNRGQTPLMAACEGRSVGLTSAHGSWQLPPHPEVAALLLRFGANPNARDARDNTPLILAARYDWRSYLGREDPDELKHIPPFYLRNASAAKRCLQLLLRYGANPNLRNDQKQTAHDWAKSQGNVDMQHILEGGRR